MIKFVALNYNHADGGDSCVRRRENPCACIVLICGACGNDA